MTKKWILKNPYYTAVFCIVAIFLNFAIYNVTHILLTNLSVESRLAETIGRLLASIGIFIFFKQTFDIKYFGLQKEGFFRGIFTGFFMFVIILANIPIAIEEVADYPAVKPSLYLIGIVIIEQLFIGIFEEFLFRGLIFNILLEKLNKYQYRGMIAALLLSSLLFASVHMLNLFDTPELLNTTIAQTVGALFMGIFLGALYLRSKNIWVVVFYHAFIDAAGELPNIFHKIPTSTEMVTDDTLAGIGVNMLANSIFLIIGLFLVRKSKTPYNKQ